MLKSSQVLEILWWIYFNRLPYFIMTWINKECILESQKRITVDETLVDLPKYVELGKARSIREMTVYKGEQVICLKEVSEKWIECESKGRTGIVPKSYLEYTDNAFRVSIDLNFLRLDWSSKWCSELVLRLVDSLWASIRLPGSAILLASFWKPFLDSSNFNAENKFCLGYSVW